MPGHSSPFVVDNRQARRLLLHLQGLGQPPHRRQSPAQLYATIVGLGFVQVDSIQWLERAQHMILLARNQTYRPADVRCLLERDRQLFEGWTHDAAIIPSAFYPYWRHRFDRQHQRLHDRFVKWQGRGFMDHCQALLELIADRGALRARDLERPERQGPQPMWQWHDGKAALEFLWRTGRLAIAGRDGFQKIYDLSERVIHRRDFEARCDRAGFVDWACRSALARLGFGSAADIARYWDLLSIEEVRDWLGRQNTHGVMPVKIQAADGSAPRTLHGRADVEALVESQSRLPRRLRALSPFDPVVRDRRRLQWLFNFHYRIEIYVPPAKREYGYYVFPLLDTDRFTGRIDMRARRRDRTLEVRRLWWEPGARSTPARLRRLDSELHRQARHAGLSRIEWLA